MLCIDWSTNIWKNELSEEATNVSIPSLATYYRTNVNELNNTLGTCFKLNNIQGTTNYLELINGNNTSCLIDDDAANVYKYIYLLSYYSRCIRNLTGIGSVNLVSQVSSDEGTIRFTERHNLARVYLDLRKQVNDTLKNLINKYKMQKQAAVDVVGDDIFNKNYELGYNGDLYQQNIY